MAVSESLLSPAGLYESDIAHTVSQEQLSANHRDIYRILMKAIPMLLNMYINNIKQLKIISNTSQFLVEHGKNKVNSESSTAKLIKDLSKKLQQETESQFRSMRYAFINIYAKIIEVKNIFLFIKNDIKI